MKTVAIIAEYNPFHSGHRYQLDQIRAMTGADYIIVAMSGDYVQRGEPALYDKYTRTAIALNNGADLVLEIPVGFASSSAEDFASCGVALLDRLGVVDMLCFGSEAGELSLLQQTAELLTREPEDYKRLLRSKLKDGASFPKARAEALYACLSGQEPGGLLPTGSKAGASKAAEDAETFFALPNNILGIEYLKALLKRSSPIRPVTIKRAGAGYHDTALHDATSFPSASAIRNAVKEGRLDYFSCAEYHGMGPFASSDSSASFAFPAPQVPVFADDLTVIFNWKLLQLLQRGARLSDFADLSPEMEARLISRSLEFAAFSERIEQLKTKQYTYTRISRALLHLLLDITTEELLYAKAHDYVSYARILGFRRAAAPLLSRIKQSCELPLITKTADACRILDERGLRQLNRDITSSHLYQSLVFQKSGKRMKNEYTRSVIIQD